MLRRLRRELARRYLLVLALVVATYCLATFVLVRGILISSLDEANHHLALPLVTAIERPGTTLGDLARDLGRMRLGEGEHLELLDPQGRVVARQGEPIAGPLPAGTATAAQARLRTLAEPLRRGSEVFGSVHAGHSLEATGRSLWLLGAGLAAMFAAALVFATFVGGWLAGKAVAPVESALARERQFTRDAAHELRTPLAVLQLETQNALAEASHGPVAGKLAVLLRLMRRLTALVEDLLTLSREDAGPEGATSAVPLAELVEEELELLAPLARARGVRLEAALSDAGDRVQAAPERLARAIRNVLDNAIRYTPPGGAADVRLERDAGILRLVVSNDGPPIPAGERENIFERFHRADEARAANPEGSGLGLPIARAIVRTHGGELALASPPGARTAFSLSLPVAGRA